MDRRTTAWLVAAAAVLGSAGAFALKEQCNHFNWDDRHLQYWRYCYSDILPLHGRFHLDDPAHPFPYALDLDTQLGGTPVEYPVATVTFAWLSALPSTQTVAYLDVTAAGLLACGAVVTLALWRMGLDWRRVAFWAVGPAMVIHGVTNWDLLAVACCMGGWWAWTRDKPLYAAILFGVGGAAKVYPAFFLPYLGLDTLRRRDVRAIADVTVGSVVGLVLPNFIVWRLWPKAWWAVWTFHASRAPDFETPYEAIRETLRSALGGFDQTTAYQHVVGTGSLALLALCGVLLAWAVWRRRLSPLAAGGMASLLFLLLNRVYSPQYTLWAIPILLALEVPWRPLLLFAAADLGEFLVRYPWLATGSAELYFASHVLVVVRWVFLAACLWRIAQREGLLPLPVRRPRAQPVETVAR